MEMEVEQFFTQLFRTAPPNSYFYGARIFKPSNQINKLWYQNILDLKAAVDNHSEADITDFYFSPAFYYRKTKNTKMNVRGTGSVWVDIDGGDYPEFEQEPNFVVTTSPGHWHCYWLLEEMKPLNEVEAINRSLARKYNTDKSGWDATQLLRPPGSFNRKRDNFRSTLTGYDLHPRANFSDVDYTTESSSSGEAGTGGSASSVEQILAEANLTARVISLLFEATDSKSGEGRSGVIFETACLLTPILDDDRILALLELQDRRLGKYQDRSEAARKEVLQGVIASARTKTKAKGPGAAKERPSHHYFSSTAELFEAAAADDEDEFWCQHLLFKDGITLINGDPGVGKTRFAFNLLDCLASGRDFIGKEIKEPIRCCYVGLDMPPRRLRGMRRQQLTQFTAEELVLIQKNVGYAVYSNSIDLARPEDQSGLANRLHEIAPQVVVIDVLVNAVEDLNDDKVARPFFDWVRNMIAVLGCSFVIITHTRKEQPGNKANRKLDDLFGSRLWGITPDTVFTMEHSDKYTARLYINKDRSGELGEMLEIKKDWDTSFYYIVTSDPEQSDKAAEPIPGKSFGL